MLQGNPKQTFKKNIKKEEFRRTPQKKKKSLLFLTKKRTADVPRTLRCFLKNNLSKNRKKLPDPVKHIRPGLATSKQVNGRQKVLRSQNFLFRKAFSQNRFLHKRFFRCKNSFTAAKFIREKTAKHLEEKASHYSPSERRSAANAAVSRGRSDPSRCTKVSGFPDRTVSEERKFLTNSF